jgi:hypothetical protein
VAVGPDTADEELDAAGLGNLLFVFLTLHLEVGSVAVQDVDVVRVDVNVLVENIQRMKFGRKTNLTHKIIFGGLQERLFHSLILI